MKRTFPCEYIGWLKMSRIVRRLALKIMGDYQPDIVVAIARGGFVPARILCDFLGIGELASLRVVHYTAGAARGKGACLAAPLHVEIRGKRVLLVDDVIDSGETFIVAMEHVKKQGPAEVRAAVMHQKSGTSVMPDYCAGKIRKWRWIIYPWAAMEDIGAFVRKMDVPPGTNEKKVQERLALEYGMRVPKQLVRDVLALPGRR